LRDAALDTVGRRRSLWRVAAVLLLVLVLAVVALTMPPDDGGVIPLWNHYVRLASLLGLVAMFVAYVFDEERRLAAADARLQQVMVREVSLRARLAEVSELLDATTEMARTFDLPAVLDLAVRRVRSCMDADSSVILLLDPATGVLKGVVAAGEGAELMKAAQTSSREGALGCAFEAGEPMALESRTLCEQFARELGLAVVPSAALCVPLRFEGARLGLLCVSRCDDRTSYSSADARALYSLADHCAAALVKSFHARRTAAPSARAA
jgi:transcriptional regulator with GAF, ATPase, and Fis domain